MNIQIKSRFTAAVLFEHDCEGNSVRLTLELAIKSGANLGDANLSRANLGDANLSGAYLSGACLSGANLSGANLGDANLSRANLSRANLGDANLSRANLGDANLSGANLSYAYLSGAYLKSKEKLVGKRPIFQIGPIGSRCAYFVAHITDKGLRFDAGCQRQITREMFESRLTELHGENEYAKEYRAALALIDAHAEIWWTPKEDASAVEVKDSAEAA